MDQSFIVEATYVDVPTGKGKRKRVSINATTKRSMVSITNSDNLCLPRAIVVGEADLFLSSDCTAEAKKRWSDIRDGRRPLQRLCADRLIEIARVRVPAHGCGYVELEQFQRYFWTIDIAIVVFDSETFGEGDAPWFDGRRSFEEKCIFLLYDSRAHHFDFIANLSGLFYRSFFCVYCNKRYAGVNGHVCEKTCSKCFVTPRCDENQPSIKCRECNREFNGDRCFANHKKAGGYKKHSKKTICTVLVRCPACCIIVNTTYDREHECGVTYCHQCSTKHNVNDLCYIQRIKEREPDPENPPSEYLYIFYDFETRQDDSYKIILR